MYSSQISDKSLLGNVFNIQQFSIHDGPGIRTLVFLKGCPLRCQWCSNPESQELKSELAYNPNKCIRTTECTLCLEACKHGAIKKDPANGKIQINRPLCKDCFQCADVCPSKTLHTFGTYSSVTEVLNTVEQDGIFYSRSGGGITISGGEPLMQASFTIKLLQEAKNRRMNTAIETSGYAKWSDLEKVCQHLNSILFDIKCMNEEKHKKFTGVSNKLILNNFDNLCNYFPNMPKTVRTPVIPSFNDNEEDILAIIEFIKDKPNVKYELLPYHRLGQPKYEYLGREYLLSELKVDSEKITQLKEMVKSFFNEKSVRG